MYLVSWDILKIPIFEGILQICDPELVNLALGGKLLWQLYAEKNHPVIKIFRLKYLKGSSLRNLSTSTTPTGTYTQNLCRRGINKFNQQLYRIPGNGKKIHLWEDKISGNTPLSSINMLEERKDWLMNKGLLRLDNVCIQDSS